MLATRSRVGAAPNSVCDSIREINDIGGLKCVFSRRNTRRRPMAATGFINSRKAQKNMQQHSVFAPLPGANALSFPIRDDRQTTAQQKRAFCLLKAERPGMRCSVWGGSTTAYYADFWPRSTRFDRRTPAPASEYRSQQLVNCSSRSKALHSGSGGPCRCR